MAPQQLTMCEATNADGLKKAAVLLAVLVVTGLLFTALLYNWQANGGAQQGSLPVQQGSTGTGNNSYTKDSQSNASQPAASFSILPGGLSRFLQ